MEITIEKSGAERVMKLFQEQDDLNADIADFCRVGDKFTGELKKDPAYRNPYIELRKAIL